MDTAIESHGCLGFPRPVFSILYEFHLGKKYTYTQVEEVFEIYYS